MVVKKQMSTIKTILTIMVISVLASCGTGGLTVFSTTAPTAAHTAVPTVTPQSTSTPLENTSTPTMESTDWVTSLGNMCIQVAQSYIDFPYADYYDYNELLAEEFQGILGRIGIQATVGKGTECKTILLIVLQITPIAQKLIGGGSCYLDAKATGEATLSASGHQTLSLPLNKPEIHESGFRTFSECPEPGEAIKNAWAYALVPMLEQWWGVPALMSAMKAKTYELSWAATNELRSLDPEGSILIPVLVELLDDAEMQKRIFAAASLGSFGPAAAEAVPALIEASNDTNSILRNTIITALGDIGGSLVIPTLIQALHNSDSDPRYLAAQALEKMGPAAAPAVPDLIDTIDDKSLMVADMAIRALRAIGPEADEAIPVLIKLLEDENWLLDSGAADALKNITGQDFGKNAVAWRQWWESQH
jgi:hypothetical protein